MADTSTQSQGTTTVPVGTDFRPGVQFIQSIVAPIAVALLVSLIVAFFSRSEAVSVLAERMYRVEDDIKEVEGEQVDASLLQSTFNGFQNDISELKTTKADALLLQNTISMFQSDLAALKSKADALCRVTAKLEADNESTKSLRDEVTNLKERLAAIDSLPQAAGSQ